MILTEDFADTEDLDGVFSGLDREHRIYDMETWRYQGDEVRPASGAAAASDAGPAPAGAAGRARRGARLGRRGRASLTRTPTTTLQHPRCVFQVAQAALRPVHAGDGGARSAACPRSSSTRWPGRITENSGRERTTAFVYSLGWTQHTVGVQYIRTAAILQTLLGNMGRPGGGILALRGHASIQGSTDIPTLFDLLPGYLPMPHAHGNEDLATLRRGREAAEGLLGQHRATTWSACSRRGGATRPPRTTTSASTTCPG